MDTRAWCGSTFKNAAVLSFSVLFSFAVAEIVLRIAFQEGPSPSKSNSLFEYVMYDSLRGWKLKPNSEGILTTPEYQTRININSNGVRGPKISYQKAADETRILILGDSFAEGYTVDLNERFSELLEKQLNVSAPSLVTVINMGVGGYSSDQELLQFQSEGVKYDPDLVILLFYDNDVFYNTQSKYWRGYKPEFIIRGSRLVLTNVPVPQPKQRAEQRSLTGAQPIEAGLYRNSRFFELLGRAVRDNYYLHSFVVKIGLADEESLVVPSEFQIYASSYDAKTNYAWEMTERIIRVLKGDVERSSRAKLLITYVPSRAAVYPDDWRATRWKYGMPGDEWNVHRPANELANICKRNGVPFLDLTSALQTETTDQAGKRKTLYFKVNGHWTPEGNVHVARALTEFVNEYLQIYGGLKKK